MINHCEELLLLWVVTSADSVLKMSFPRQGTAHVTDYTWMSTVNCHTRLSRLRRETRRETDVCTVIK